MEVQTQYFDIFSETVESLIEDFYSETERDNYFEDIVQALYDGYMEKDAIILFILGMYCLNEKKEFISLDFEESWDKYFKEINLSSKDLFLQAAHLGLVQAKLWCAYCYTKGIYEFEQSYKESEKLLVTIKEDRLDYKIEGMEYLFNQCRYVADAYDLDELAKTYGDPPIVYYAWNDRCNALLNLISLLDFPEEDTWNFHCWIGKMNLYNACDGTNFIPPVIPKKDSNKALAISLNEKGLQAEEEKDFTKSASYYLEAISYYPKEPILYLNLGKSYFELKEKDNAIWAFQKAADLKNPDACSYIGRIYAANLFKKLNLPRENDDARALLFFEKAADLYTDPQKKGINLYYIARIYYDQRNWKNAAMYAWVSSLYEIEQGKTLYNILQESISEEEKLEIEQIKDIASLKEKNNLLKNRVDRYTKHLYFELWIENLWSKIIQIRNISYDCEVFQHFISIYHDTEELEQITRDIFYNGFPARVLTCEYCTMVIDMNTVTARSNFFGAREAARVSTLSWLIQLICYNSLKVALEQRDKVNDTISNLREREKERRGLEELSDLMMYANRHRFKR